MAQDKPLTPEVTWAQRSSDSDIEKNFVYVTINAPDVSPKDLNLDLQSSAIHFKGYSGSKKATYEVTLELYADIDASKSQTHHTARGVEFKLFKTELKTEYWPRLLKDKAKVHFLKTDFDKWVDEDEQDALNEDDPMAQFGGGGDNAGFGGLDFSKLGGAGAGGMGGMGGLGDEDEEEDDMPVGEDEDDEMPDLEDEEGTEKIESHGNAASIPEASGATGASTTQTSAGSKIEELE